MLRPGEKLAGKYEICSLIAEGGMSEVYLARQMGAKEGQGLVAIKRMCGHIPGSLLAHSLFESEARIATLVQHTHIISAHEYFVDDEQFFIAMEFFLSKPLAVWTQQFNKLSAHDRLTLTLCVGRQVLAGLNYIHSLKVPNNINGSSLAHGDISPNNILINEEGLVKVCDFGAANFYLSSLGGGQELIRGNLRYMSPEQLKSQDIDGQSDLYSLGLVMLELLLGQSIPLPSTKGENRHSRDIEKFIGEQNGLFNSQELNKFFSRALCEEKNGRFQSSEEMAGALTNMTLSKSIIAPKKAIGEIISRGKNLGPITEDHGDKSSLHRSKDLVLMALVFMGAFSLWLIFWSNNDMFKPSDRRKDSSEQQSLVPINDNTEEQGRDYDSQKTKIAAANDKTGSLSFVVKPWADVFIDGEYLGATPMSALTLPAGDYLVQLRNSKLSAIALKMVKIYPNKKTELVHNF